MKPHACIPTRRLGGFTLLEMILAIVVTAIVSASLFATMSGAFKTRRQAEDHLSGREAARAVIHIVRSDLQCVPPAGGRISGVFIGENLTGMNSGDADALTYITANSNLASAQDLADLRQVELRLLLRGPQQDYYVLGRMITGNLLATITPEPELQVLARRVVSMNVQYFDGNDWLDAWDSTERDNELPAAVELVLVTAPPLSKEPEDDEARELTYITTTQMIRLPAAEAVETGGINLQGF
ncbi:MAG: prepilin-type N-terminal cleavage/methylation domain-containing protein [Phycisphaeraceae bacterium]|nr:prepilin-type N-terminal cleavage/methylation domain-containing protein [Phycisphaeraceae bacterium]